MHWKIITQNKCHSQKSNTGYSVTHLNQKLWNLKVHCSVTVFTVLISLSWGRWNQLTLFHFISRRSTLKSFHLCPGLPNSLFYSSFEIKLLYRFLISQAHYLPCPSHPLSCDHPDNIYWRAWTLKLLTMQFSQLPVCTFCPSPNSTLFSIPLIYILPLLWETNFHANTVGGHWYICSILLRKNHLHLFHSANHLYTFHLATKLLTVKLLLGSNEVMGSKRTTQWFSAVPWHCRDMHRYSRTLKIQYVVHCFTNTLSKMNKLAVLFCCFL